MHFSKNKIMPRLCDTEKALLVWPFTSSHQRTTERKNSGRGDDLCFFYVLNKYVITPGLSKPCFLDLQQLMAYAVTFLLDT